MRSSTPASRTRDHYSMEEVGYGRGGAPSGRFSYEISSGSPTEEG